MLSILYNTMSSYFIHIFSFCPLRFTINHLIFHFCTGLQGPDPSCSVAALQGLWQGARFRRDSPLLGNNSGVSTCYWSRRTSKLLLIGQCPIIAEFLHLSCPSQSWLQSSPCPHFPTSTICYRIFIKYRRNAENIIRSNVSQLLNLSTFIRS